MKATNLFGQAAHGTRRTRGSTGSREGREVRVNTHGKGRIGWRAGAVLLGVLVPLAGCASSEDVSAVRRDVLALRQEVANLSKAGDAARGFTDQRLNKIETDVRSRVESTVKETEGSRAALASRLDELATETRLVQGKLEENAFVLGNLNTRLDGIDQQVRLATRRLDGVDQQMKALDQQVRGTGQPPQQPPATPPAAGPPVPPSVGQPPGVPPAPGAAPGAPAVPTPPTAARPATPPGPAPPPAAGALASLPPEEVYKNALADYTRGNYDLAIAGFRTYIQNYPKASLVPNAQYWLGEAYYSQKNYAQAIEEFKGVIRDFPDSPKVPSSLFKQGDAYLQLGDTKRATEVLCDLIAKHPRTREARLARERNVRCR
jgi:tol-pal system protein YbgF